MKTRGIITLALSVHAASSLAHPAFSQAVDSAGSRTGVTWCTTRGDTARPTFFSRARAATFWPAALKPRSPRAVRR